MTDPFDVSSNSDTTTTSIADCKTRLRENGDEAPNNYDSLNEISDSEQRHVRTKLSDADLTTDAVQKPLPHAREEYLACQYKDITKYKEVIMTLPLCGIEAMLARDDLQVISEDDVCEFVLSWVRLHYNSQEERREVLGTRLARLIRFPYMTYPKLDKVLKCDDFAHKDVHELVLEALFSKAEAQQQSPAAASASLNSRFTERAYKVCPIRLVEFDLPLQQCVVYLDLKQDECASLFPRGYKVSRAFCLGGQGFILLPGCYMDEQQNIAPCFGIAVGMKGRDCSGSSVVECEFAARFKPGKEFVTKLKYNFTFTGEQKAVVSRRNLFEVPWSKFIAENSPFFINGVLHLRAKFTIKH